MVNLDDRAQKAIEEWVGKYPKHWNTGVCGFVIIDPNTGVVNARNSTGGACHAQLSYGGEAINKIVVNAHKADWHKKVPDYLRWIAKESPFSHGILNRDDEDQFLQRCSVTDSTEIGRGGVLWVCKAARYFQEDTWKPELWLKLREAGLDGLQAFVGASMMSETGKPMNYSHVNLFGYGSPDKIRKEYDKLKAMRKNDTGTAAQLTAEAYGVKLKEWGSLEGTMQKIPDGWGGFIEKMKPGNVTDYAAKLKEILEGDPKNVG